MEKHRFPDRLKILCPGFFCKNLFCKVFDIFIICLLLSFNPLALKPGFEMGFSEQNTVSNLVMGDRSTANEIVDGPFS